MQRSSSEIAFDEQLRKLQPHMQRIAFGLSQGLSDKEIANLFGISTPCIKSSLEKMRDKLGFDGTRINLALAILRAIG